VTHLAFRPKHRADDAIADRDERIAQLAYDNETLMQANELLVCELTRAVIRACQDSTRIAALAADLEQAVTEIRRLQRQTIRDAADKERLRQAVVDSRPRIKVVDTQLVRPYAPVVQLPYVSPVDAA